MVLLTKQEIFDKYPEELTFDEFDDIKWDFEKQFGLNDDRNLHEICKDALDLIKRNNGEYVLYTQVDGDDDRVYAKGNHFVNRTGIWWVVKCKEFEKERREFNLKLNLIAGTPVLKPSWKECPKCHSTKINVEETGFYSESFLFGVFTERNVEFAKLGPTITSCLQCGYEEEEDVN